MRSHVLLLTFICEMVWLWLDSIYKICEVYDYGPSVRWWGIWLCSIYEMVKYMIMFHLWDGEVLCWEMDDLHSTLGYGVLRSSKNLGELASDDYPAFGTLIWREKLTSLTLLLLTGSETILFGVGSLGSIYIILVYGDHSQLSSMWLCKTTNT